MHNYRKLEYEFTLLTKLLMIWPCCLCGPNSLFFDHAYVKYYERGIVSDQKEQIIPYVKEKKKVQFAFVPGTPGALKYRW